MPDQGLLRIGELSRRSGVSPELLRAWERRYRLLHPTRSQGGLRLYSLDDLERVRRMQHHLARGLAAAEAASLAGEQPPPASGAGSPLAGAKDELTEALATFDEVRAHAVLDSLLATATIDTVLATVVIPYLHELGERWERGDTSIAQEHFASAVLRGRLLGLARGWGRGLGPAVVLACAPGEQHDLGLIAFGLALRARGWRIVYLGPDTPIASVADAARASHAVLAVVSAVTPIAFRAHLDELRTLARDHRLALGGAGARRGGPERRPGGRSGSRDLTPRGAMSVAIVLFTRDLRVHDQSALTAATATHERVVPMFVLDEVLLRDAGTPNRVSFLLDSLRALRASLRHLGGDLVVRRGDVVTEVVQVASATGAKTLFVGDDVSSYAQRRLRRLRERLRVRVEHTMTGVAPGELAPEGRDHFRVFTPYWRRWREQPRPPLLDPPGRVVLPRLDVGRLPEPSELVAERPSPGLPKGGEGEARRRLERWLADDAPAYDAMRDDLAADRTSRLSPYLHFGCISANEVAARADTTELVRQLCWRDFYAQLLAANPHTAHEELHARPHAWDEDEEALARWRAGRTGVPIVDAGIRQLHAEGWMHNRARLIVAAFLTKTLRLDWRHGMRTFAELLVDADVANNAGNWQWVAGTGVDPRRNRRFNPLAQAGRRDPSGDYVRRYVPELAELRGAAVHEPWRASDAHVAPEYPAPLGHVA